MRTKGSPDELEHRRQLAVHRYLEGHSADEIAELLGISPRSVWRWLACFRNRGSDGLTARRPDNSESRARKRRPEELPVLRVS